VVVSVTLTLKSDTPDKDPPILKGHDPPVAVEYELPPFDEYWTATLVPAGIFSLHPRAQYARSVMLLRLIAGLTQEPELTKLGVTSNVGEATNDDPETAVAGTVAVMVSAVDIA